MTNQMYIYDRFFDKIKGDTVGELILYWQFKIAMRPLDMYC